MDAIIACAAANETIVAAYVTNYGSIATPTFIKVVSPWMPTIDTLATIAGDGQGLIVNIIQLGIDVRQLYSLFRLKNNKSLHVWLSDGSINLI